MELWLFFRAILKHWWALLSCALFTGLGAYILYENKSNDWAFRATIGLALFCLLLSTFLAWKEKHQAFESVSHELALARDRSKPKLSAEFQQISIGEMSSPYGTHFMANIQLRNAGADSIAKSWLLSLSWDDSPSVTVRPEFIEDGLRLTFGNEVAVFTAQMRLEERAMQPLKSGCITGGWLRFLVIGVSPELFRQSRLTLHFQDFLDSPYVLERDMLREGLGEQTIGYYPGSGGNPFRR